MHRISISLALLVLLVVGCAGPSKLAKQSEDKLAKGDVWRAWTLATKALDKAPANAEARAAAAAAASAIATDWQRRIRGMAMVDSIEAAEQAMEFVEFRANAVRYTTVQVDPTWVREERTLRDGAARACYARGTADMKSKRPKSAYRYFVRAEEFSPRYRDSAALADRALELALTRVAILPLRTHSANPRLGRDVAASWRGDVVEHMADPGAYFTRILPLEDVERSMRVSDLDRMNRDQAIKLGRKAGAERVVYGTIGEVDSKQGIHFFTDRVVRRVVERNEDGTKTTRWVEVPIEVIARTRTVKVDMEYEVISTKDGATLARRSEPRTMKARVVWTAYMPEGAPDTYALFSEETKSSNPTRCQQLESKWQEVVGEGTTLIQVLEAKRTAKNSNDSRAAIARLMAGAAFVLMEELPSTEELTFGALAGGWQPLHKDLVRLDGVDDVDLGVSSVNTR
jgi:hypothetical protein